MISESPAGHQAKPTGSSSFTGQRIRPPAFDEPPLPQGSTNHGQ
jgi:hypothetical protein